MAFVGERRQRTAYQASPLQHFVPRILRDSNTKRPLVARTIVIYNHWEMGEPPSLPERRENDVNASGGINITGGEVRAGRDIVAGDVNIAGDSISGNTVTVQRGYTAEQVQRLVLIVGGLVFATALFFFIIGAASAAVIVGVLSRPLQGGSDPNAAQRMQQKVEIINSRPPGSQFRVNFTEDELSSYFRFIVGPRLGIDEGKVRLMDEAGKLAIGGNLRAQGGLPFILEVDVTKQAQPFQVRNAWVKLLPTGEGSSFGWVSVPFVGQNLSKQLNDQLLNGVQFTAVQQTGGGSAAPPEIGNNLLLTGVRK